MAYSFRSRSGSDLEFSASELAGALGDSVTVLPLLVALGATTSVSLPHVLVGFGVFQIVWGVYYGLPLSVEPMKALLGWRSSARCPLPNSPPPDCSPAGSSSPSGDSGSSVGSSEWSASRSSAAYNSP